MRIGEILRARGHLTDRDIESALRRQVVHGGRFGTCAVEVAEIALDSVADALADQSGIAAATGRHFDRADAAVLRKISPELAAEHRAIALGWISHHPARIAVAAMDPLPPATIASLETALEAEVVPAIAPELRILYFLERVYGIARMPRFRRAAAGRPDSGPEGIERRHYLRTLSDTHAPEVPQPLARIAVRQVVVGQPALRLDTVEGAVQAIQSSASREQVGDFVIAALETAFKGQLRCGVIFGARDGVLIGWKGFVAGRGHPDEIEGIAFEVQTPSMLREPFLAGTPYFGPPRIHELDRLLWAALGLDKPGELAVVPVVLRREVVCLLYADSAGEMDATTVGGLAELGQGLAAAFDRLVKVAESR
jgi:hypothetical protein